MRPLTSADDSLINQPPMTNEAALQASIDIAKHLAKAAVHTPTGCYWETLTLQTDDKLALTTHVTANLYDGVAGIVLFLLHLSEHTQQDKHRHLACEGLKWLAHHSNKPSGNLKNTQLKGFYLGPMGVVYTFLQAYRLSGDQKFLLTALHIVKTLPEVKSTPEMPMDLLSGVSGTLLALLHLYWVFR